MIPNINRPTWLALVCSICDHCWCDQSHYKAGTSQLCLAIAALWTDFLHAAKEFANLSQITLAILTAHTYSAVPAARVASTLVGCFCWMINIHDRIVHILPLLL